MKPSALRCIFKKSAFANVKLILVYYTGRSNFLAAQKGGTMTIDRDASSGKRIRESTERAGS